MDNELTLLKKVKKNPNYIKFINNPSEELQIQAVKEIGYTIKYISDPSLEIQRKAIIQNPYAIEYFEEPCEEIQLLAINIAPKCYKCIKNPTEKVKELFKEKMIMLNIKISNKKEIIEKQIFALEWQIKHDINSKDKEIHCNALCKLKEALKKFY